MAGKATHTMHYKRAAHHGKLHFGTKMGNRKKLRKKYSRRKTSRRRGR